MADLLPVYDLESSIVSRLKERRRLILCSPTGSGKSTQVPQMLLRHGFLDRGQVVILQPRRLAARLLAARVADERNVELGRDVGYQIRFENLAGPETKIKFVTEGILLRQMIQDSKLAGIAALIFDEFHERHLYGDITLARALDVQERDRPDLLIIVMSATLDSDLLSSYLNPCALLTSEGRVHPVAIEYAPARPRDESPVWDQAADAFSRHIGSGGRGDVLVFMPGAFEIARTIDALRDRAESKGFLLLPLHGELPPRDQDAAVARHRQPKVIVSTNVAETSLTIDGIRLVIDSGLARLPRYDPYRGINTLTIEKISRASADQRAGRAGRTAPGTCIRLWSEREHSARPAREVPEVRRLDLSEVALTLKEAGVRDLRTFRWLEPPDEKALVHAEELLTDLGALKAADGTITGLGRRMLAFPVHPRYARMLLAAQEFGCVYQAALAAALTQGRDLLLRGMDGARDDLFGDRASSDFSILMRAWAYAARNDFRVDACQRAGIHAQTARQVGPLLDQFLRIAEREGFDARPRDASDEALRKCLLIGFSDRVARRVDDGTLRCELVHGRTGVLARESVVRQSPLFVAAEIREVEGKGGMNTILSLASAIEPGWLRELFPGDMNRRAHVEYDSASRRVVAEDRLCFRDLVLEKHRLESPPADAAARLLAGEIHAGRLKLNKWDHDVDQWIWRLNLLSRSCPDLNLPPVTEEDRKVLVEHVCHGAFSARDLKDRPVMPAVKGWLNPAQQALVEKHAPERIDLPNGRKPRVTYVADGPPYIAVKIQDLYGVSRIPALALGRVAPLVHILAPSMRPVQITQDLAGFWREHYPKLRRELQRKYPKHEWREMP